jgi:hypothetical protein
MAGGIFKNQPFHLNPKCIFISFLFAGCYWFLPSKKWYILLFILYITYLAIAWYDEIYNCKRMMPTALPFGRLIYLPFKPKSYQNKYKQFSVHKKHLMDKVDHITLWTILIMLILVTFIVIRIRGFNGKI